MVDGAPRMAVALRAVLAGATKALAIAGSGVVVGLTALVVADICLRNLIDRPVIGTSEIGAFLLTAIVFLQFPDAALRGRLTSVEFMGDWLRRTNPSLARALKVVSSLTGCGICGLICYAATPDLYLSLRTGEFFGTQGHFTAPAWPVRSAIVIGSGLAALAFLHRALDTALRFYEEE